MFSFSFMLKITPDIILFHLWVELHVNYQRSIDNQISPSKKQPPIHARYFSNSSRSSIEDMSILSYPINPHRSAHSSTKLQAK